MPTPSTTAEPTYVALKVLAARWGVSLDTADKRTRQPGFPLVLQLGPRTRRWPLEEVVEWEKSKRSADVRRKHVVTGSRPEHKAAKVRPATRKKALPSR